MKNALSTAPVIVTATAEERDVGERRFCFRTVVEFRGEGIEAETILNADGDVVSIDGTYPSGRVMHDALTEIAGQALADLNGLFGTGRGVSVTRWSVDAAGVVEYLDDGEPLAAAA